MKKIWSIFDNSTRIEFIFLSVLLSFNTLLETISLSLLIPIIVSLTDNNLFELYPKISIFIDYFQEIFSTNIINMSLILFGITIIFKNLFQTYINFKEANLNMRVQEVTSQRLFNAFLSRNYSFHLKSNSSDLITKIRNDAYRLGINRAKQDADDLNLFKNERLTQHIESLGLSTDIKQCILADYELPQYGGAASRNSFRRRIIQCMGNNYSNHTAEIMDDSPVSKK